MPAEPPVTTIRFHAAAGRALSYVSTLLAKYASLALAVLLLLALSAALAGSRTKHLWHDELFTYYLAQAPTLRTMWADLRIHDLNPPLVYLLTRWSFALFGVSTLATRVPEMFFFGVMIIALYRFVALRMGPLFGLFAAALVLLGKTFELAYEARPYTLLLGLLAVSLAAWQASEGPRRRLAIAILLLANTGMLLSHIFAVPAIAALIAAEIWRSRLRHRLDFPVAAAFLLPFLVTIVYVPMLQNHGSAIYPQAFQPTGETIFDFYIGLVEREAIALLLTALLALLLLGPAALRGRGRWSFTQPEWVAILALLSLPLALMLQLMASHGAFFPRYGAAASVGLVCLAAATLGRWISSNATPDPRAALLGLVVALAMSDHTYDALSAQNFRHPEPILPPCQACALSAHAGPNGAPVPLVDASGLTFLEMNHNEPATTTARLFYLTDAAASTQYSHANIFEQTPQLIARFHLPGHSENYHAFLAANPHFFVLGKYDWPEDWLLRKLVDDGANVRVLGRTKDQYRDREIYEVTTRIP